MSAEREKQLRERNEKRRDAYTKWITKKEKESNDTTSTSRNTS